MTQKVRRLALPSLFFVLLIHLVLFSSCLLPVPAYGADSPALLREVRSFVKENYLFPVDDRILMQDTAEGIIQALGDPHSEFLSAEELESLLDTTSGSYAGVGMELTMEYYQGSVYPTVLSTFAGSPARRSGLTAGDRITAVNGESTSGKAIDYIVSLIKGEPGTRVSLTISRNGVKPFSVQLTRENIQTEVVTYTVLEDQIGYIGMSVFAPESGQEVRKAVQALTEQGCKGIILDLRGNPGGYMDAGVETAEVFVPHDQPILHIRTRNGTSTIKSDAYPVKLPLAVLINGESASASEIVAGALKDYQVGTLIGTTSYGKGTVQVVQQLKTAEAAVKLTIAEYLSPKGNKINGVGVAPDLKVEGSQQQLEAAQKVLLQQIKEEDVETLLLDPYKGTAYLDGLKVAGSGRPFIDSGVVMVPLRLVNNFLGGDLSWDSSAGTAALEYRNKTAIVAVGRKAVLVNSGREVMPAVPKLVEGRIYVPLRLLTVFDGISIDWNPALDCAEVKRVN